MKPNFHKKNSIIIKKAGLILAILISFLINTNAQNTAKTSQIRWISPPDDSLTYGKSNFMLKFCVNTKAKYDSISVFINDKFYTLFASNLPSTNSCKNDFEKDFVLRKGANHIFITTKTDLGETHIEQKSIFYEPPIAKKEIIKVDSVSKISLDNIQAKPIPQSEISNENAKKITAENTPSDSLAKIEKATKPQTEIFSKVAEPEKVSRAIENVQENVSQIPQNANKPTQISKVIEERQTVPVSNSPLNDLKLSQNAINNESSFEESFEESSQSSSSSSSSSRRGSKKSVGGSQMPITNRGTNPNEFINSSPQATSINAEISNAKRVALVIGNGNYLKSPLKNATNDAYLMSDQLRKLGFEVNSLPNATQFFIKKAIDDFGKELAKDKNTVGLFYYAGHGMQVKGKNYIVPVDAQLDSANTALRYCIDLDGLLSALEDAQNTMNIIILDACRNDPFGNGRDLGGKGLATINAPSGTIIAFATSPGATASDGESTNGLYTRELVKVMDIPNIKLEDVFKKVRSEVRKTSNGTQIPWENSSIEGDFYFKR